MLCISREQGAFEIHIESFKLSKEGYSLLSCRHGEPSSLYFTWNFYSFSVESRTSLRKGPSYLFQNACIYLVDIRKIFLQYIKQVSETWNCIAVVEIFNNCQTQQLFNFQKPLELNLLADDGATPMVVGRAQLNVSEVLMFPHNKIQLDTRVMSVEGECRSHMNGIQACSCQGSTTRRRYLGNLSVWFRLTCEMETLKMHSDHLWTAVDQSHSTLKRKSKATLPEHQKDSDTSSVDCGGNDGGGFSASDADETFVDRQNLRRGKQVDFKVHLVSIPIRLLWKINWSKPSPAALHIGAQWNLDHGWQSHAHRQQWHSDKTFGEAHLHWVQFRVVGRDAYGRYPQIATKISDVGHNDRIGL